ncbi:MAG: flagellar biosynthetic protein FliP, partial [Magnetospirillum sp.]
MISRCRLALAAVAGVATAVIAGPVLAQSLSIDLGGNPASATSRIIQLVALTTVLSLAPSILVMVTSFTRFVVVLGFLRQAMGTQQAPPNTVMVSLAIFMTAFVMGPTFEKAWETGIQPVMDG